MLVDLHCHSLASDGSLPPDELVARAHHAGIEILSITDHDTIAAYHQISNPLPPGLRLIVGVELSCVWGGMLVHIVGLAFDPDNPTLMRCIENLQKARAQRARIIDQKLDKLGFAGVLDKALQGRNSEQLGRPHLAQAMVELGYVKSTDHAFKRYLGAGKVGDVKTQWPAMAEVIEAINAAGGQAVLAHPYHYSITATKLRALIADFKLAGGQAIEVLSGKQAKDKTDYLIKLTEQNELLASCGSDFHRPGHSWNELGCHGTLPDQLRGVWSLWSDANGNE